MELSVTEPDERENEKYEQIHTYTPKLKYITTSNSVSVTSISSFQSKLFIGTTKQRFSCENFHYISKTLSVKFQMKNKK
jgi:hypothetical protein